MRCRPWGCQPCQTALLRRARRRGSVRAQRFLGRTTSMRREGPLRTLLRRIPTNNCVRRARTASAAAGTPLTSVRCCGGAASHLSPITSTSSGASLVLRLNGPRSAWERVRDRTPSISVADAYVSRGRAVILHYPGKMDGFLTSWLYRARSERAVRRGCDCCTEQRWRATAHPRGSSMRGAFDEFI